MGRCCLGNKVILQIYRIYISSQSHYKCVVIITAWECDYRLASFPGPRTETRLWVGPKYENMRLNVVPFPGLANTKPASKEKLEECGALRLSAVNTSV